MYRASIWAHFLIGIAPSHSPKQRISTTWFTTLLSDYKRVLAEFEVALVAQFPPRREHFPLSPAQSFFFPTFPLLPPLAPPPPSSVYLPFSLLSFPWSSPPSTPWLRRPFPRFGPGVSRAGPLLRRCLRNQCRPETCSGLGRRARGLWLPSWRRWNPRRKLARSDFGAPTH